MQEKNPQIFKQRSKPLFYEMFLFLFAFAMNTIDIDTLQYHKHMESSLILGTPNEIQGKEKIGTVGVH